METKEVKYLSEEWHALRHKYLGGSEAAAAVGLSPFKSVRELWEEKTGRVKKPELTGDYIAYGQNAEKPLAELFALDFPQYIATAPKDIVYISQYREASLDLLLEEKTGEHKKGFCEIKTANDMNGNARKKWANNSVPEYYYCQALHYFIVNPELKFAYFKAQIKINGGELPYIETLHRYIARAEVESDINLIADKEDEFWWFVTQNKQPNGKLFI